MNFLEVLSCPKGFNMSLRHVSVSTCGIVPRIYELAEKKLGITLSISLHASNNKSRSEIMPVNDRYDINELLAACRYYFKVTGRRISFRKFSLIRFTTASMASRLATPPDDAPPIPSQTTATATLSARNSACTLS